MLLEELDLEELDLSGLLRQLNLLHSYCDGCYDRHYDSYCNGRYNGQDGCCDGCCDCCCDSTTKARPPEGLKGQRAQEEEAEATGGGDTTELATKKASMPTVQASKALESLKYIGF